MQQKRKIITYREIAAIPTDENKEPLIDVRHYDPNIIARYEKNDMFPIREFYLRERKDIMTREWKAFSHWNSSEVKEKLKLLNIHYPEKYDDYFRVILNYLKEIKFLTN